MNAVPAADDTALRGAPGEIVDAVFAISCRSLPVDHAYALSRAVQDVLPWFAAEPCAALHIIRAAESGSGWLRPEGPHTLLHLSRRTRLALRVPRERLEDSAALLGRTLDLAGHPLHVERLSARPLSQAATLLARCVLLDGCDDESAFRLEAARRLDALGIRPAEMLCGLVTPITMPERTLETRSLMLTGLTREQSMLLQGRGLGGERKLGCGVFIPCKAIGDLRGRPE